MTDLGTPTQDAAARMSPLRTAALVLAAGSLLGSVAIGTLLELILKATNPDGVDVTNGLAYLRPLLITSWTIGAVLLVLTIVLIVVLRRREGAAAARPAWIVLVVQVVLVLVMVALEAALAGVTGSG